MGLRVWSSFHLLLILQLDNEGNIIHFLLGCLLTITIILKLKSPEFERYTKEFSFEFFAAIKTAQNIRNMLLYNSTLYIYIMLHR